jgi:hypothetical protein
MIGRKAAHLAATLFTGAALLTLPAPPAAALDVDAGDYEAAPPGTNLAILYGFFGWRNKFVTDSGDDVDNSNLNSQIGLLRLVHYLDIGITIDPQIFLFYGSLNNGRLGGESLNSSTGFGDIIIASTFWFVNQPEQQRWFGVTPFIFFPTGTYRDGQTLNFGENRYKYVLQAGYVEHFGDWIVDLIADTTFYGDNDDAGPDGNQTLEQNNSFQTQAWLRYKLSPEWLVGAGWSGTYGGKVEVDGRGNGVATKVQQLRAITQFWARSNFQLQAIARTDVWNRGGFREQFGLQLKAMAVF